MSAVEDHLVREADQMILLFTPPFDRGSLEPAYIKGYVHGIREIGGQYHSCRHLGCAGDLLEVPLCSGLLNRSNRRGSRERPRRAAPRDPPP